MKAAEDLISLALNEDLGAAGDVTSRAFIPADSVSRARIVSRCDCVASGIAIAAEIFRRIDQTLTVTAHAAEGEDSHQDRCFSRSAVRHARSSAESGLPSTFSADSAGSPRSPAATPMR